MFCVSLISGEEIWAMVKLEGVVAREGAGWPCSVFSQPHIDLYISIGKLTLDFQKQRKQRVVFHFFFLYFFVYC